MDTAERFEFGENWARFLERMDERRVGEATASLRDMLGVPDLRDRSFLDIGCGSGLFSLAARRLGAEVRSFDFDAASVGCAQELRRRFFADDPGWQIERGSVLDRRYLNALGRFDVVYSWGVLHHTGAMWLALENAISAVADDGALFIAIYNDQGVRSHLWWFAKYWYNKLPRLLRPVFTVLVASLATTFSVLKHTLLLEPMVAIGPLGRARRERGMSARHDWTDWVGGFPFEFASFELLVAYFAARGFSLVNSRRTVGWGCNELVLRRTSCAE